VSIISAYPNPFNPSCTIQFYANRPGVFLIKIYDLKGELVLDRSQNISLAGLNKWTWDGTSFPGNLVASGIYLVQVSDGISNSHTKIIMAK
jgi:flagellar hook assembly protein FlgD